MTIQKNSQILVTVEEALADLIVVSYCTENKKFEGVLLDSNKRNLPCGVYNLHPAFSKNPASSDNDKDKLYSVNKRFTYEDPNFSSENIQKTKKSGPKSKPQPRQKMTVRLRPRKVLCSNCKGICNENNEIVNGNRKRKMGANDDTPTIDSESSNVEKRYLMGGTLIPKLSRLQPSEISNAIKGSPKSVRHESRNKNYDSDIDDDHRAKKSHDVAFVSVSDIKSCFKEDIKEETDPSFNALFSSAKTLKICFGEGEGTVVKIPAITSDYNEDSGVSCDLSKPEMKAAKRALKKARKEAKKNISKKIATVEITPNHIGALSPRNSMTNASLADPLEKKHKHKVKHKKKHKPQRGSDENTSKYVDEDSINYFSNIKDHCIKQKLSINLRRLSSNSYEHRNVEDNESGSEDWDCDTVPDFPKVSTERINDNIVHFSPGDIVWGKITGFPWWPGRVISVTPTLKAHVAWFASSTTSLMTCNSLSPFLEDYKIRFNKKKRGPYKEAVKQATIEAKRSESHLIDPLASPGHLNLSPQPINVFS